MNRPYTNEELNRAIRLRMAGYHPKEICVIIGRTKGSVDLQLSKAKQARDLIYPKISKVRIWTDERIEQEAKKYPMMTYKQIAEENNVKAPRIYYLMAVRAQKLAAGTWRA